jgi:hypothetical protein
MNFKNLAKEKQHVLNGALETARQCFELDGYCAPVLLIGDPKKETVIPLLAQGVPKSTIGHYISVASQRGFAIFVAEAWLTEVRRDQNSLLARAIMDDPENAVILPPHDDPNRKEGVMVQYHEGDRLIMITAIITRDGAKPSLGEWTSLDNIEPGQKVLPIHFGPPDARCA